MKRSAAKEQRVADDWQTTFRGQWPAKGLIPGGVNH